MSNKKRYIRKGSAYDLLLKDRQEGKIGICAHCGKHTENLSIDHIVPFTFIHDMGMKDYQYDHDWNFQVLCRPCNNLKGSRFDFTDPRTIVNLKKYVELAEQFFNL